MAKNAIYDYSIAPGDNADIGGTDISGATGKVFNGDNAIRSFMEHAKEFALDLGAVNTVGGTADAIAVTLAASPTALVDGMRFAFTASAANTGATTLTATPNGGSSLGAKAVRKISGGTDAALAANDILAGGFYDLIYDSAANSAAGAWILVNAEPIRRIVHQVFSSPGASTYTPTSGMRYCVIEAVGAGGGGGGVLSQSGSGAGGGGGGGGCYARSAVTSVTIGASQTVTIGAGGTAGSAAGGSGASGGDTSVGSIVVAPGGSGGTGGTTTAGGNGGAGGTGGTGDVVTVGGPGHHGCFHTITTIHPFAGSGGASFFGGGGRGNIQNNTGATAGGSGAVGGGGGGAVEFNQASGALGSAGSAGYVVVTEYCS